MCELFSVQKSYHLLVSLKQVKANDGSFLHLRIFRPLPHTKENPELHSVLENKSEDDVLGYF